MLEFEVTQQEIRQFALREAVRLYKSFADPCCDEDVVEAARRFAEFVETGRNHDAPYTE